MLQFLDYKKYVNVYIHNKLYEKNIENKQLNTI